LSSLDRLSKSAEQAEDSLCSCCFGRCGVNLANAPGHVSQSLIQSRGRNSTSSAAFPLAPQFRHRSCRSSDMRHV
jgi:hypothetical protein